MKLKRILSVAAAALIAVTALTACGKEDKSEEEAKGSFIITLYPDIAPITCENFEKLVEDKFYDGLTFHRVMEGFMAQGGDPKGNGTGGSDPIKGEFKANGVENNLSHTRGVVSMTRMANDYDSGSCQFFICYDDCSDSLDGQYAAFGKVTSGMEVVDDFLTIKRTANNYGELSKPVSEIKIISARMIDKDGEGNPRVEFKMNY